MKTILAILVGLLILQGCQVGRPSYLGVNDAAVAPLSLCSEETKARGEPHRACLLQCRDTLNPNCQMKSSTSQAVNELRLIPAADTPQLGLTLSGGGSKVAPFAIGVLKRFVDEGWIFKTQYLTSVSGGSYAAFYLYYRAYRAMMAEEERQNPALPSVTPSEDPSISAPNAQWPGLTRYFVDSRNYDTDDSDWPYVDLHSVDWVKNGSLTTASLSSKTSYCLELTTLAETNPNTPEVPTPGLPPVWAHQNQEVYQGWVECYQDMLMTHPTVASTYTINGGQLAADFEGLFFESALLAPTHWFANVLFDWKKNYSPSQTDYLHGIVRTYAFFPNPGKILPVSLGDETIGQITDCLDFKDVAEIYMANKDTTKRVIGGYLPKWVMESTGTNGNVGLNWSPRHYDLSRDVFEISFDEYGSGRFGYVEGSPSLIGLNVPWSVLASAAFADAAQRNLSIPRGALDVVLQTFNIKWGIDVANYNVPDRRRYLHSLLIWPFYYLDDPTNPDNKRAANAPTIHLSDGGQSGDNLGLVSMFRRDVRNIVVAAGEDDYHEWGGDTPDGWLALGSLCAANYYLMRQGYTMVFEADPRDPNPPTGNTYDLSEHCTWDGDRQVFVHPDKTNKANNISPFNWVRRVWVGTVMPYKARHDWQPDRSPFPNPPDPEKEFDDIPFDLTGIHVYYLNAAIDRSTWVGFARSWYPNYAAVSLASQLNYRLVRDTSEPSEKEQVYSAQQTLVLLMYPTPAPALVCESEYVGLSVDDKSFGASTALYSCPLLNYVYDTDNAVTEEGKRWVFPQTSTAFTTFDNSVNLFRAYRDLGWQYAGALEQIPEISQALQAPENPPPVEFQKRYPNQASVHRDPQVCRDWVGPDERKTADEAAKAAKHAKHAKPANTAANP
jgi:hypothetical protein